MSKHKARVVNEVERMREELVGLSLKLHSNPELSFEEVKAAGWLTEYLEAKGFALERGFCGLPTAFRASYGTGNPRIAFIAEYDAMAGTGHSCGHNLIAASSIGAAAASKTAVDLFGGQVQVIGTPGEERIGGKVIMLREGGFKGVDAAMKVHPSRRNVLILPMLAREILNVEFTGREASELNPEGAINALEAMVLAFESISSLRRYLKNGAWVNGVITDGGKVPQVIPARSAASIEMRCREDGYMAELKEKVLNCFKAAALATGAGLRCQWEEPYTTFKANRALANAFGNNMEALGRKTESHNPARDLFSCDMGNVSQSVPSLNSWIAAVPGEVINHTRAFADAAGSKKGQEGLIDAAKAMAMTAFDLLSEPALMKEIKTDFALSPDKPPHLA